MQANNNIASDPVPVEGNLDHPEMEISRWEAPPSLPGVGVERGVIVYLGPRRDANFWYARNLTWLPRFKIFMYSLSNLDRNFNDEFHYPVLIFHEDYDANDMEAIRKFSRSKITFARIDLHDLPPGTNKTQAQEWIEGKDGAVAGRDIGYRGMCRFWCGPAQQHPAMKPYRYYLRLDDDSILPEKIDFDLFQVMEDYNRTYGYRLSANDLWGVNVLWQMTREFMAEKHIPIFRLKAYNLLTTNDDYNGNQFYNNFHISRVDFWRSQAYLDWWEKAEAINGFFKYRWGDANVHTLLIDALCATSEIHLFKDSTAFKYYHNFHSDGGFYSGLNWLDDAPQEKKQDEPH